MIERVRIAAEVSATDGYVEDPYDTRQFVSLRAFDGADPELFLEIMFIVPAIPGDDFPALYGDAVILTEYTLPAGTHVPR